MANTRRKTTVYLPASPAGTRVASRERSKYNTSLRLHRQDISGPRFFSRPFEAVVPLLANMTTTAAMLHAQGSGPTVSVTDGNMAGFPRFAVSTHTERIAGQAKAPTWNLLFAFAALNSDLLLLPDHAMGTWFQNQRSHHVLVVVCPLIVRGGDPPRHSQPPGSYI